MIGRLKLRNIGPFETAELELKPITILTGVSGSGKSFLLRLLYVLLTALKFSKLDISKFEYKFKRIAQAEKLDILKEGRDEGSIELTIGHDKHSPIVSLSISVSRVKDVTEKFDVKVNDFSRRLFQHEIIDVVYLAEDRIFCLPLAEYIVYALLEELEAKLLEEDVSLPEISRNIDRYVWELKKKVLTPLGFKHHLISLALRFARISAAEFTVALSRLVQLCNEVLSEYGRLECAVQGPLVKVFFSSRTGHVCPIEDAPEAVKNLYVLLLPVAILVESVQCPIILMDHVEEHVTPPLTESYIRTIIELVLRGERGVPMLVMSVHNLDAFTISVNLTLDVLESLGKDPDEYLSVYELKLHNNNVTVEKLPITELGVKIPEYLTNYAKTIVDLTRPKKKEAT